MAAVDPRTLGLNLYLLIGLLLVTGVGLFLMIACWTSIKIWLWRRAQRRADREYQRGRVAPDGTPYPPASRGICSDCGELHEKVYHLRDGRHLCRAHFDQSRQPRVSASVNGDA